MNGTGFPVRKMMKRKAASKRTIEAGILKNQMNVMREKEELSCNNAVRP